jgi:hypothetical protein
MTFKKDQQVRYSRMDKPATVISGPHKTPGVWQRYLIEKADGNVSLVPASELSELDGRAEEVAALMWGVIHVGSPWSVSYTSDVRDRYRAAAEAVLAKLAEPAPLKVGDRIRILKDRAAGATVCRDDVLTVMRVHGDSIKTDAPRALYAHTWEFPLSSEGTAWERA